MSRLLTLLLILTLPISAAADPVVDILAAAEADCRGFENGTFAPDDSVLEADLDGQEPIDRIVDSSRFACSTAANMYCGSGGCSLHAIIGDQSWEIQAEGWRVIDWNGLPILLIARDGGWCGGAGAQICFEAVSWSDGRMMTVMPQ